MYKRIIGNPWVYDHLRPWFFGGFDLQALFDWLDVRPSDVVVDVGCGTGMALDYLADFQAYHGFDLDKQGLARLKRRHPDPNVHVYPEPLTLEVFRRIRPTRVLLVGLLHHLPDSEVETLLGMLASADFPMRIVTLDVAYLPGRRLSNLLARLDRGRHVRDLQDHTKLIEESGLRQEETLLLSSGNGWARYPVFYLRNQQTVESEYRC